MNNTRNIKISKPSVGFEPMITAGERTSTHALVRAATRAKVKNEWSYASTPPVCRRGMNEKKVTRYLLTILKFSKTFTIRIWK
jgi:hypothetical protein